MEHYAKSTWRSSQTIEFNEPIKKGADEKSRREETNIIEFRSDFNARIIVSILCLKTKHLNHSNKEKI